MPRAVALLDVDHTLLFDKSLNQTLLDSLARKGIMDIYLFTDMTLLQSGLEDRNQLIEQLQGLGFTVHAVLTPNDVTWDDIPNDEASLLHTMCFKGPYKGELGGNDFEKFIISQVSALPRLYQTLTKNYSPDNKILGRGYAEADLELKNNTSMTDETIKKSIFAKAFTDLFADINGYNHTKGLMLDLFLRHRPSWVSSIVVADDNDKVINTINSFQPVNGNNSSEFIPPITMIPVKGEDIEAVYYDRILQNHLNRDPIAIINNKIDVQIKRLKLEWNPFKSSARAKTDALEQLKKDLLQSALPVEEVEKIIDIWLLTHNFKQKKTGEVASIAEVISQHRNLFRAEKRPGVDTATQIFIKQLITEFGEQLLTQEKETTLTMIL